MSLVSQQSTQHLDHRPELTPPASLQSLGAGGPGPMAALHGPQARKVPHVLWRSEEYSVLLPAQASPVTVRIPASCRDMPT